MLADVIKNKMDQGVKDLQESLKRNDRIATGDTSKSIRSEVTTRGNAVIAVMYGPKHLPLLQSGRRPTHTREQWAKDKGKGGAPIAPLERWLRARGLNVSPWAIKYSVDTKGFKGTPGLIDEPLGDKFRNEVMRSATQAIIQDLKDNVNKALNGD